MLFSLFVADGGIGGGSGDQVKAVGGLPLTEIIFTGLRQNRFVGAEQQESGEDSVPLLLIGVVLWVSLDLYAQIVAIGENGVHSCIAIRPGRLQVFQAADPYTDYLYQRRM